MGGDKDVETIIKEIEVDSEEDEFIQIFEIPERAIEIAQKMQKRQKEHNETLKSRVYLVVYTQSCSERIRGKEEIDDKTVKKIYKFPKEIRQQINKIREKYFYKLDMNTIKYSGLRFTDEEGLEIIKKIAVENREELQKIDPSLTVRFEYFDMTESFKVGNFYQKLGYAILIEALNHLKKRLSNIKSKKLSVRTKRALINDLERIRSMNFFNDRNIELLIDHYITLLDLETEDLKKEINENLNIIKKELEELLEKF